MNPSRFRALTLIALFGLSAGCAGPSDGPGVARSAATPDLVSGVTTPGQAYLRELTVGAADGMRKAGWFDQGTELRVARAREAAELFRFDLRPEVAARYDAVRLAGFEQGVSGAWDRDALNGYLDVIEAGDARFLAIEGAGHADHAWVTPLEAIAGVTGAAQGPLGRNRHGHAVVATALASEINEASLQVAALIARTVEERVPAVEVGDRLTFGWAGPGDAFAAYAEVLPTSPEEGPDELGF